MSHLEAHSAWLACWLSPLTHTRTQPRPLARNPARWLMIFFWPCAPHRVTLATLSAQRARARDGGRAAVAPRATLLGTWQNVWSKVGIFDYFCDNSHVGHLKMLAMLLFASFCEAAGGYAPSCTQPPLRSMGHRDAVIVLTLVSLSPTHSFQCNAFHLPMGLGRTAPIPSQRTILCSSKSDEKRDIMRIAVPAAAGTLIDPVLSLIDVRQSLTRRMHMPQYECLRSDRFTGLPASVDLRRLVHRLLPRSCLPWHSQHLLLFANPPPPPLHGSTLVAPMAARKLPSLQHGRFNSVPQWACSSPCFSQQAAQRPAP